MGKYILLIIIFFVLVISIYLISKKILKNYQNKKINKFISSTTIDSIDSLSGIDFEEFLYYLFLNLGFDVYKTKASHDYGADLILKTNNISISVQCKLYYKHSVGTSSIQEVYSSIRYYNNNAGIVITNSKFTPSAIKLAASTNIILWDREMLIKLINLNNLEKNTFKRKLLCSILNER